MVDELVRTGTDCEKESVRPVMLLSFEATRKVAPFESLSFVVRNECSVGLNYREALHAGGGHWSALGRWA